MNSQIDPVNLSPGTYFHAYNTINRGGVLFPRPGYQKIFTLPSGRYQGGAIFSPTRDVEQFVFVVDGQAYMSKFPFETYMKARAGYKAMLGG